MTIPVASPIVKGFVGANPVITVDVPVVAVTGVVTLTDGAHWGRLVEATGGAIINDALTTGFQCHIRNTGTSDWSFRAVSAGHPVEGIILLKPGQTANVVKRANDAYITLLEADDFLAPVDIVVITGNTSLTASQVGRYCLLNGANPLTITLPPHTSVKDGDYFIVDNATTASAPAPSFVAPAAGSRIAGVVNNDPVPIDELRMYRYSGDAAWTRISGFGASISPQYSRNVVESLSLPSGRAITASLWASTYGDGVLQGGGLNILPPLSDPLVTVGSSIRFVATDPAGMEIGTAGNADIEFLSANNASNYGLPHNNEMLVMKRSATSNVWRLIHFGPLRQSLTAGAEKRFDIVPGAWLGEDGDVQDDVANHELTRIGFTRGSLNQPETIREIFDNTAVTRGPIPNADPVTVKVRSEGPGTQLSDYDLNAVPAVPGTYFILVQRPDEAVSASDDGTGGGTYSVERVDSTFDDYNQYRVIVSAIGAGATAVTVRGGTAAVHNITLNDRFLVPQKALGPHSVTLSQLSAAVVSQLVSAGEKYNLATLAGHIIDVNNTSARNRDPKVDVRYEGFFFEPTSDGGAFPTNKAPDTTNIVIQNPSASGTRLGPTTTSELTQRVLEGPSLRNGGFDVVPLNGVLTLATDRRGILIVLTADHTVGQQANTLWEILGTDLSLRSTANNQLEMVFPRPTGSQQTQTRREQLFLQDPRGRQIGVVDNSNLETEFFLPASVTTARTGNNSIQVNTRYYDRATDVEDHWLDIQNFEIPDIAVDVAETSRAIGDATTPNGARTVFFSYTASSRRIKLRYASWTQTQGVVHVRALTMNDTVITVGSATGTFSLPYRIPTGQRNTIAAHLWRQNNVLNFRIAVNGRLIPTRTTALTTTDPTGASFVNPTVRFGPGNYPGFLQKILVGEVTQTVAENILSGDELSAISGRYDVPLYGLTTPAAGTHEELTAQGIRWERALNSGSALPTVSTVETIDINAADDEGRPPIPPLTAADIHDYRYELIITQVISGAEANAVLNWSDLGLTAGSRDYRYRWRATIVDPTGNEMIITPTQIRIDLNSIASHAFFAGTSVTATLRLIRA